MNIISDVLQTNKVYKAIWKAIDSIKEEQDRDFLHIMLGRIEYRDWRRRVLNPSEFKQTYTYTSYQRYNKKYDDEFLKKFWIEIES